MVLSDKILIFADNMNDDLGMNMNFSNCMIKKSELTSIKICNGNFKLGLFTEFTLENCICENTNFQELKCKKCVFKNYSFINCRFVDHDILETIFSDL